MKNFVRIEIAQVTSEQSDILIAELSENKYYAFEQGKNLLIAYVTEEDFDKKTLLRFIPDTSSFTSSIIQDQNWNGVWEQQVQPVIVGDFVGIRPSFHSNLVNVVHEIIITPKMSFGTGHHATTFLMIEMMQSGNFSGKSVLDFGTGTGVLAILAEKLGAASVIAIDYDEWSINNALENIEANECRNIIVDKRDTIKGISGVDIILANINLNVLAQNVRDFSAILKNKGSVVISGILYTDEEQIASVFASNGFIKKQQLRKEDWIALRFENQ